MPNTYTLLETITVGAAGASSVTFNSIPQTGYTDLVIKISARQNVAFANAYLQFNGSSGANYSYRRLRGDGSTASSATASSQTSADIFASVSSSSYTANTFSNAEIYVPNYTSANFKSFSVDAVNENNATQADSALNADLWSQTAAITSVTLLADSGAAYTQHSTFTLYGVSALGVTPTKAPKATGGSIIQTDGTYWYHAFLSSGEFKPATALSCDVLVVAGGGGGGTNRGAGGGAGGYSYTTSQSVGTSAQTITIGAGGPGATSTGLKGTSGSNSVFAAITATGGGGGGGNVTNSNGINGGSGGGGGCAPAGTAGTGSQGSSGGAGSTTAAGGGGGATGVGAAASGDDGGIGGTGSNVLSTWLSTTGLGVSGYVAGGGGGGSVNAGTAKAGGAGGGGTGGTNSVRATDGTANTGSGGGGSGQAFDTDGGDGGSGLVIVRYLA